MASLAMTVAARSDPQMLGAEETDPRQLWRYSMTDVPPLIYSLIGWPRIYRYRSVRSPVSDAAVLSPSGDHADGGRRRKVSWRE